MNTALSGLDGYSAGIGVVSGNLANQTTPGYSVETVNLSTSNTTGQAGAGVQAPQITRAADGYTAGVLRSANSYAAAASIDSVSSTAISNSLLNNGDVQSALNQFFLDAGTLAANPTSTAQRQTLLADAQTAVGAFRSAATALNGIIGGATSGLQQNISTANNLLSQLAAINQGLGQTPNDPALLDQQQAALQSLSSQLAVNVIPQGNGQVLVASGGTVLLDQGGAQTLSLAGNSVSNQPQITAGVAGASLNVGPSDGNIGANTQTWKAGSAAIQALNAHAVIVAASVNQVQAEGLTGTGVPGASLFSVPTPTVVSATSNAGTATLTAQLNNAGQLPTDGGPFILRYNASAGWSAVNQASGQIYNPPSGSNLSFAGLSLSVSGSPASGDQFTVNPAPDAASAIQLISTNQNAIASADPYVVSQGSSQPNGSIINSNTGTIVAGSDIVTASPSSNAAIVPSTYYGQTLQITFSSANNYNIESTNNPATVIASGSFVGGQGAVAVAYPAGAASGQFWQVPLSGRAAAGDALTLSPGGSNSGSNASRLAALWTAPGTTTAGSLQQSIIGLGTSLASNAQQATQRSSAASANVTAATNNLQNIAGVSLDQQAVILTGYSQAYQAAAQVISTAHTMFESLLQAI